MVSRQAHWDEIYSTQALEKMSWFQSHPTQSIELIERARVGPGGTILDVGGGDSLLVDSLLELGHQDVTVLDVSPVALDRCRRRLGDKAESVGWVSGDVTEFRSVHRFDLWHDRAVFHFLTSADERRCYVEAMEETLRKRGQAIVATFSLDGPPKCSGLDVRRYSAESLAVELGGAFQLLESREQVHRTPAGVSQPFVYGRFMKAS